MEPAPVSRVGSGMTVAANSRRDFLALASLGGLVFSAGLPGCSRALADPRTASGGAPSSPAPPLARASDFFFLQLSDTHWGFEGAANPEAGHCLKDTVQAINAVSTQPDFIVFTGDLTQKTNNGHERRARMQQFRSIVAELKSPKLVFLPGEHDAAGDEGEAYRETFGELSQSFEHQGVYFITLDNASKADGALGPAQLEWLEHEVTKVPAAAGLVVLAHRPLFALYPEWSWSTPDGERAIELLSRHANVTVFYGHIHQEHHHTTGAITHHAARSLVFPLPAPAEGIERAPLAWDPSSRDHGLGHRAIRLTGAEPTISEVPFGERGA